LTATNSSSEIIAELSRTMRVSTSAPDRVAYARDLWPRGLIGVADGVYAPHQPDAIVWPTSTEEVAAIVKACIRTKTLIVPYGSGSGVCGGAVAIRGGLIVDCKRMRKVIAVDAAAGSATLEAGMIGDHLEHELNRRGLTMGHFPSSIMCSTLGGWLAARSAGQLSTRYGKIEDMVRSATFVDGTGQVHELVSGAQPDLLQLAIGSEGTLGIFTRATVTVHPLPAARYYRGWSFPRVAAGCEAIRRVVQRGLRPACVRLYNELDSFLHRRDGKPEATHEAHEAGEPSALSHWLTALAGGKSTLDQLRRGAIGAALGQPAFFNKLFSTVLPWAQSGCLLVMGFEGQAELAAAEAEAAKIELELAGGKDLGPGPGERWLAHRYAVSFRMSKAFESGAFVDTMEVCTTWDQLLPLYAAVQHAVSPHAFVMAHFSHAYADGCSIYFTFAAKAGERVATERRYDELWRAALTAVHASGASISHHHGVGLLKAPFMPDEHGDGMRVYRGLKTALDPHGILNPGKMGL